MTQTPHPSERGFWRLVALQFQGAFSDNIYKQLVILGLVAVIWRDESKQSQWNSVVSGIFVLPGFLVSIWAGFLADKHSKRTLTLVTKSAEIVIMLLATAVFLLGDPERIFWPALAVLFLLSNQFTFFSPNKYGIIPELVQPHRLSWANGVIELTTFMAIILGTGIVPLMLKWIDHDHFYMIGLGLVVMAGAGLIAGWGIDHTPPANPTRRFEWNFLPEFLRYCRLIRSKRMLFLTILGLSYFWFLGLLMLTHINVWGEHSLGMDRNDAGWLYILLSLGIGVGAMVAGYLSRGRIELGLIPLGGIGMAVFALPMALAVPGILWVRIVEFFCVVMVGVSAGFFSLPLNAILQHHTNIEDRGGILAANNFFNACAMVSSAAFLFAFNALFNPKATTIFYVITAMTLAATAILVRLLPEALLRFIAFILTSTIYRIRPLGLEKIPAHGGMLLISNHVSYVDSLLLGSIAPRPVRFVAHAEFFKTPVLGYFLRATRSIPVASEQRPRELIASLKAAAEALAAGEIVCLFPEGQLTRTGQMQPFHRGYEVILREHPAPIVPVYLDGVWGSIFSYEGKRVFWKLPRRIPYPVRVVFGDPLPPETSPFQVRQRIEELGAEAALAANADRRPLHHHLVASARKYWGRFAMVDPLTPALTWGRALTGAVVLARRLSLPWKDQTSIGVLLPPSVAATLVNYAAALSGRTAINLNYTTGQEVLEHSARQSTVRTVVTARKFLEKIELKPPAEPIYIEDCRADIRLLEKLTALLAARLLPIGLLERYCRAVRRPTTDQLATIIFSSGSTGVPKGVPLTHANIVANIESFRQAIRLYPDDRLLGTLPFFHSFGYTVSLWGGALLPFGCVFHHNPLDAKTIGELAARERVTLIITTPTFLQMYARRIPPGQFGGVKVVVAGAERLPDHVADSFIKQFGIEPLQGYGTTECSPVVSVNVSDHRSPGIRQVGNKRGSIGQPLPGVAVRTIDVDSGRVLGPGETGLLEVKGANVMSGYLDLPEKSAEVLKDGWYNTGDMALIDEDGFVFITGRLSRFSKIGGEMVPHEKIEDQLHALLGLEDRRLAVTGVPDEIKGEQLVVLYTLDPAQLTELQEKLPGAGLPNIFIPRRDLFFPVEELPLLGSGKLDLKEVNRLARELVAGRATSSNG